MVSIALIFVLLGMPEGFHSVASKAAKVVVIEGRVTKSEAGEFTDARIEFEITKVGLGNLSLKGQKSTSEYTTHRSRSFGPRCYCSESGRIPVGEVLVLEISVRKEGLFIHQAWREGKFPNFEDGRRRLADVEKINGSKDENELLDLLGSSLKKSSEVARTIREIFGAVVADNSELLKTIASSEEYDESQREIARQVLKRREQPLVPSIDKKMSEAVMLVETTTEPKQLLQLATKLADSIRQLQTKDGEKWRKPFFKVMLDAESRPVEEIDAILVGVNEAIETEFWARKGVDSNMILWDAVFQIACETKSAHIRKAWEDILVKRTEQGALFIKEDVLARLKDIKDPTFRDRLRDAAYTPSERFKAAPKKPE